MTTTDPLFGMLLALGGAHGQVSPLVQLIPFALVLAIFYFVILLPMKNRQKKVAGVPGGAQGRRQGRDLRRPVRLDRQGRRRRHSAADCPKCPGRHFPRGHRRLPGTGARCRSAEHINHGEESSLESPHHSRCRRTGDLGRSIRPIRRCGSVSTSRAACSWCCASRPMMRCGSRRRPPPIASPSS